MAFLSGPRQIGKTTLAQATLPEARYFNYDRPEDALCIAAGPDKLAVAADLANPVQAAKGVIFDEIHKFHKWKSSLKGFFDVYGEGVKISVTGSARLDAYKRGGDSMAGRYFQYRVHPVTIGELRPDEPDLQEVFQRPFTVDQARIGELLRFGGYPEPFLKGNDRFRNRWKISHDERIFHEDLRDLSRVQDIRGVQTLAELLSARVSGGINLSGLAADLQVTPDTAKAWLELLETAYVVYEIRPWFRNVANSIRKQPKVYFWDWSTVKVGGMRNENFMASHLLKAVHWWCDSGLGDFGLFYLRDKQQREVDFLVTSGNEPYLLVECKTSASEPISENLEFFRKILGAQYAFQVAIDGKQEGIDPFAYPNRSIKVSAIDLLTRLY